MTYESTLAVARIIQRCPEHQAEVLSCRHEVSWPDGSRIGLHPVRQHGAAALYLRAVHEDGQWLLLDLRQIAPAVARDLPAAPLRDQPGTVLYGLRAAFHRARDFLHQAQRCQLASWPGSDREPDPRPRRATTPHHAAAEVAA